MEITEIIIHHSGGRGTNNHASTRDVSVEDINKYHKQRWGEKSSLGYYVGYHFVYDPKTRKFTQTRAIGEEGIHTIGHNHQIGVCIIGNYNKTPIGQPKGSIDPVVTTLEADIASFLRDLIDGNKRGYKMAQGAVLSLSQHRIYPHRAFAYTDCYGTFLKDNWARDLLVKYVKVEPSTDTIVLKERLKLLQQLVHLYQMLLDLKIKKEALGSSDRACEGFIIN